jgi:TPR repeat protein
MMKYHQMAIDKGNSDAMFNLGRYYQNKNDIENMMNICKNIVIILDKGNHS